MLPRTINEVIKTVVQGGARQNREEKKMAEMCVPKEPGGLDEAEPHYGVIVGRAGLQGSGRVQVWPPACKEGRGSGLH